MKVDIWRLELIMVLSMWATFSLLMVQGLYDAGESITNSYEVMSQPPATPVAYVKFDGVKQSLQVPSWRWLETGRPWSYVSKQHSIDVNFVPELTDLTVVYGDWVSDKRAQPIVNQKLQLLTAAAQEAGLPVIVTSAYRSAAAQQQLTEEITAQYGPQYGNDYVAQPGQSEHQLGLAVDFSSFSDACKAAFAQCRLDDATAAWLAEHAHEYGFILRYPEGKESVTGVKYESWHFRYVGTEMAGIIHQSGLTFDEIYQRLVTTKSSLGSHL